MPGKPGNTNALKHGGRTQRHGLVLATLGKQYESIYVDLKKLRRYLESQVVDAQGTVPFTAGCKISEALAWEMSARVAQRQLATNAKLQPAEVTSLLGVITNATRNRNAAIAKLGLTDAPDATGDPWAALDAQRAVSPSTVPEAAAEPVGGRTDG